MSPPKKKTPPEEEPSEEEPKEETSKPSDNEEIQDEDFQFVLKALLEAYQPILEEELRRSKDPEGLQKEAESESPSCEDEITFADRIFSKFLTEEVALRMLPPEGRELLGPIDRWRWCLLHIRCCIIFGWLVCRGQRTFRSFIYYIYWYWRCVRQALGTPIGETLTDEQRKDFQILVDAFSGAYKPYLADQLASIESPHSIPEEILSGELDCSEGEANAAAIFERFLSVNTATALLGREAFEIHSQEPFFWFCRCWCLCAIRFGCCLAHAHNLVDVLRCLLDYFRCVRDCFRPLICELTDPHDCVEEHEISNAGILRGVEFRGTASGASCDHYTLEWRQDSFGPWQNVGIHYPGNASQGACGVMNGILGYLATFPFVPVGPVQIRLCVYPTGGGSPDCCTIQFELQRNIVWITGIEGVDTTDRFDPTAQLEDGSGVVRSFGTSLKIFGSAEVGGCLGSKIKRYTLSYHPGFVTNPNLPGFVQFWQVDYLTPLQTDLQFEEPLTSKWREFHFPLGLCAPVFDYLQETRWSTQIPQAFPITPSEPPCPPPSLWTSTPLPLTNCQSGRYTLRLTVEDTGGGIKHDLQQVWFDNKEDGINKSKITQIGGVDPCATINLSLFAVGGGDCTVPWPASLLGIAYDEYIEEGNFSSPSDNFDGYQIRIRKDGGSWFNIPIPGPGASPWGPPYVGTSRVGDPGVRCATASPPPGSIPPETPGILAVLDMSRLDAVCNPAEPGLTLKRGECCGYVIWLQVRDKSICPGLTPNRHQKDDYFPFFICNDMQ